MNREPDWEALSQMQFLLLRRVVEPLNAALAATSLVHLEQAADKPREYWQDRATQQVMGVLGLVNAWHALIRFKLGELLPHQHIRPFPVQDMLDWLTYQMQVREPFQVDENTLIEANRESLQEALLLLYSAAFTLGPNVNLLIESRQEGVWFRVRYAKRSGAECPTELDTLLQRLSGNWRSEDAAFELRTAADFITLNGSQLHLQGTQYFCEMAFFIYAVGKRPPDPLMTRQVTEPPPIELSTEEELLATYKPKAGSGDRTMPLPETLAEELTAIMNGDTPSADWPQEPPTADDSPPANGAQDKAAAEPAAPTKATPELVALSELLKPDAAPTAQPASPAEAASFPPDLSDILKPGKRPAPPPGEDTASDDPAADEAAASAESDRPASQ